MTGTSHSDSHPRLWMIVGRSISKKSAKMTRHSEWTPRREKFFEKSFWASSSRNRIWEGVGSEEDNALERKGFWDGADLRLGAINTTNVNRKRGRERKTIRKDPKQFKYNKYIEKRVRMHGECMNMWYAKEIASWAQPIQSYQHTINCTHLKCIIILLLC